MAPFIIDPATWRKLVRWARREVDLTLSRLPDRLRDPAQKLPVAYETQPAPALEAEGVEADTLGLFVGPTFAEEPFAATHVPSQIILFLLNIWEMSGEEEKEYRAEVRTTYLHELGHYLGLDEQDLSRRGLE